MTLLSSPSLNPHYLNLMLTSFDSRNPFHASPSPLTTDDVYQDNVNPFSPDLVTTNPFLLRTPLQQQQSGESVNKGFSISSDKPVTPLNDVTNISRQPVQFSANNNGEVKHSRVPLTAHLFVRLTSQTDIEEGG